TATRPASVTVAAGSALDVVESQADTTVQAELAPSGAGFALPVAWKWDAVSDSAFAQPGIVSVAGVATGPSGERLDATLTVIVTAATENNVAPQSAPSATYTESGYPASNTINGVTTDKGWSNWRGGTKNDQDALSYVLTKRGDLVTVPTPSSGAPSIDVPVTGAADEVRVVMDARPQTHMIVSEVSIFAAAASRASVADLARLTVGDQPLADFDPRMWDYTVASMGSAWPTLHALAIDQDAAVDVTQPGDAAETARGAGGVGTVRVTAPDGTEQTYSVTIVRTVRVDTPTLSGEPRVGSTVRAAASTDPADATRAFVWLRDGTTIDGATGDAYTLTTADAGHEISVDVTASAPGYTAASARSVAIVPVAVPVDPGTGTDPGSGAGPGAGGDPGASASAGGAAHSGPGSTTGGSSSGLATTGLHGEGIVVTGAGAIVLLLLGGFVLWRRRRGGGSAEG
ncbi:MAG: hypothetical protein K0R81_1762, partial [Microbacterium sp.]|nr:hypothetical protein [Microbacterium sp.]